MKKVFRGWTGKGAKPDDLFKWNGEGSETYLRGLGPFKFKGTKDDWEDWPPKKVTITVEVED